MRKRNNGKRLLAVLLAVLLFSGSMSLEVVGTDAALTKEIEESTLAGERSLSTEEEEMQTAEETISNQEEEKLSEQMYYQWQTLEEILRLCEEGLDLKEFFRYTIWDFLSREEIQRLVEEGRTLEDLYAQMPALLSLGDTRVAGFSGAVSAALGEIPALGGDSHGPMLKIHLSGETAFCARYGAACRTGMTYLSVPLEEIGIDEGKKRVIQGLLAQYVQAQAVYTGPVNYIMTQAGIWLVQNGEWSGDAQGMAAAVAPLFEKTPDCPSVDFAADYFRSIVNWLGNPAHTELIDAVELEAWANGPNQYLLTVATDSESDSSDSGAAAYAHIEIEKRDSKTGNIITEDATFTIYEWNGSSYKKSNVRMTREGSGYRSDDLFWTVQNQGKFQIEETIAPADGMRTGYYGDFDGNKKRRYGVRVEETMQGEAIVLTNQGTDFVNHRATGSIRICKKDIEADAYLAGEASHGMAGLDGAVYDLYAGEAIVHPDGVTGVLYEKDSLVASGRIQHGTCIFTDLYLGSYYVKERQKGETTADGKKLSYAPGYLLDEAVYEVLLPYEGEAVENVHRNVYSIREQVIKAKAVFEKVEGASGQGNISYLEGAGFTLYRVDRLSKQASFRKGEDETYEEASIREVYLVEGYHQGVPKYDFSGEEDAIATVYLRDTLMREDTTHYWQDGMKDLADGKLIPLGSHKYRVAELFSDKNGQVVTPYLPYGQYLVVETTVPRDHFMAPPFLLTFQEEKTEKVLTIGVTEETPYGRNLLKSGGDQTYAWEAVYFSKVIENEAIEELLRIYKKDADTGKTVLLAGTKFRIAKIEEETGEKTYLTHTTYYPETVNRDVFVTTARGYLQLPELLPVGLYQIEEIEGPNGFYNEGSGGYVRFRVTTERKYESLLGSPEGSILEGDLGKRDVVLIIEDYENRETRGKLTIRKMGEVLTGYKPVGFLESSKEFLGQDSAKQFVYEEQPLAGAEYTIRAAEDIVTQDRQLNPDGTPTLWFARGEIVAVVQTGAEGQTDRTQVSTKAYPKGHPVAEVIHDGTLGSVQVHLPLGIYEIEETRAPYGYTRTEQKYQVQFTWENQFQEFVYASIPIAAADREQYEQGTGTLVVTNPRIKVVPNADTEVPGVEICKIAKENGQPLAGVSYGLYTVDPIYSRTGEVLVDAGALLAACTTAEKGKSIFEQDVPTRENAYGSGEQKNSGRYEIRELSTPSGVLMDPTPISIEFTCQDDKTEFVIVQKQQENVSSGVWISKQDLVSENELEGAALTVIEDWSQKVAASWISDGISREIRGLAVNQTVDIPIYTYTLTELSAPDGYYIAQSIRFQLVEEDRTDGELKNSVYIYDEASDIWIKAEEGKVIMRDAPKQETRMYTEGKEELPKTVTTTVSVPVTGDRKRSGMYMGLVLISVLGILAGICQRRKKL